MTTTTTNEPITLFNGDKMFIDESDSLELRKKGIYDKAETEFIHSFVKPDMICVDVGANIGYYTLMMAKIAKHVSAFEPDKLNYDMLKKNLELNDLFDKVTLYPSAVGERMGQVTLYKCATNNGMHRVYPSKWCGDAGKEESIHMVTLDWTFGHNYAIDFIKIDIEGAEYGALLGMQGILKEQHPVLMMEFNVPSIKEYGKVEPRELFDYILHLGYDISFPDRPLTWEELNELGTKWGGINIVCTPRECQPPPLG